MASIVGSAGPSAAQRRRATLDRKGYSEKRRLATEAPNNIFYGILVVSTMLIVFGLIMVLSSSSIVAINTGGSPWNMFRKQATWATFGLFALFSTYRMPYHTWHKLTKPVLAFAFGLMLLPFVPGVGITTNGARAWAQLGPIRFQPSEVLKVAVLLYCASVLGRRRAEIADVRRTFRPVMYVWAGAAAACLMQKDFGAAIVFTCIILATLFIAGTPLRLIAAVLSVTLLGSTVLIASSTRMQNRFLSFMDIEGNKGHYAYQVWQSILSIANGGVTGVGAGQGTGKWGYVPLAHSDFIFAIVAEEFGLIGALSVIGGFLVLAYLGIQAALGARDPFGALLAGGITTWLCAQACINIGGVIGAMPVTGLTLPLISYGGSSLFMTMAAVGLLLNVARNMK
jgi:cell division protein FtsW